MTICTFSALVTSDLAARDGAASRYLHGARARCVVQAGHRQYLPGLLSGDKQLRPEPASHALLSVALREGEAEAIFAAGLRITIWADAIVVPTICGDGFFGSAVIERQESPVPPGAGSQGAHPKAAGPALPRPTAATHRQVNYRQTVAQPRLGTGTSLAGRSR